MSDDPYHYPGTKVLRNKENIRDEAALAQFERLETVNRLDSLPPDLPITVEGFRSVHRYLLQNVYDWAGELRTVPLWRTAEFCRPQYIEAELDKRFALLHDENNLRGLNTEQFAARAAVHVNELNAIHAFREGNGRTQRAFLVNLAEQADYKLDLTRIDPVKWNQASIHSFYGKGDDDMGIVIAGALEPRRERSPEEQAQLLRLTEIFERFEPARGRDHEPDRER